MAEPFIALSSGNTSGDTSDSGVSGSYVGLSNFHLPQITSSPSLTLSSHPPSNY